MFWDVLEFFIDFGLFILAFGLGLYFVVFCFSVVLGLFC